MKKIILLLILFPIFSYSQMETLQVAKEDTLYKPLIVRVENLNEAESFWVEFFKILLPTVAGGLILWIFQYFTQIKQNRKQEFENRINSYLEHQQNILNDIRADIYFSGYKEHKEGREFFIFSRRYLRDLYEFVFYKNANATWKGLDKLKPRPITDKELFNFYSEIPYRKVINEGKYIATKESELEISRRIYQFYFRYFKDYVAHYFRHLYNVLNFITEKKRIFGKKSNEPQFLADMIQARLSPPELFLLFYNGIIPKLHKMHEEITNYNVIENLAKEDLLNPDIHPQFYPKCKMKSDEDLLKFTNPS